MFCPACGAPAQGDARFCAACGTPRPEAAAPAYPGQPGYPPQQGYPPQPGFPPQPGYQPQPVHPPQPGHAAPPSYPAYPGQPGAAPAPIDPSHQAYPPQQAYPAPPAYPVQQGYPPQPPGFPAPFPSQSPPPVGNGHLPSGPFPVPADPVAGLSGWAGQASPGAGAPPPFGATAYPPQPPYASPAPYGAPPSPYGAPPTPYGTQPSPYAVPPSPYGAPAVPQAPWGYQPAQNAAPVAERRLVSILFADLVGWTTYSEGRDPEEVRATLSRYFEMGRDIVARYGGTVEKFIGDAVMAVWGTPVAREDDAERAVRAALELVAAIPALAPGISARGGVLTGEAAVTIGAVGEGMVAGDLVNTAARIQAAAEPGSVFVGEATMRAASGAILFESVGEQQMKGKAAPVPVWRTVRVVGKRRGEGRGEVLEAPFVGREDELRMLKELYHATTREGRVRLVSVIGPGGIGKSRLAWEFLKYIDGLAEDVWWHDGRSPAYGDGVSFWALGEMVRTRCGLVEDDDEETTRAKVGAKVAELTDDPEERRWIAGSLLTLLGRESGIGSEQLFGAWRTFFERLAESAPVVLVFEDLHFADPGLLDFIDHLIDWAKGVPIYVVTLARPELTEKRPTWGAGKKHFTSIYLEPLAEPQMRELLAGLVPGLPDAAVKAIVARADGLPLYAVETVRMLVADGKLEVRDGIYHPVGDLGYLAVPETLQALIASRLDGLAPAERALVSDAAVLGQSFTTNGLSAVSAVPAPELEERLRALVRREIFTVETDPRSPERGQYVFVQALIREVAYNTLAKSDRKVRHMAAARYFESLGSEEIAGALAGHWFAAYENASEGAEADEFASKARVVLRAAADRASALGSNAQALTFLDQGLQVTTEPADRIPLLERAGITAALETQQDLSLTYLDEAIELARAAGDRPLILRLIAVWLRYPVVGLRRWDLAAGAIEAATAEFADLEDDPWFILLIGQSARIQMMTGAYRESVAGCDRALVLAEQTGLDESISDLLVTKGTSLTWMGRRREGIGLINAGARLAESVGNTLTQLRAAMNASGQLITDDLRLALDVGQQGFALALRAGDRTMALNILGNSIDAAMRLGEWAWVDNEVIPMYEESAGTVDAVTLGWSVMSFRILRAEATGADLEAMIERAIEMGVSKDGQFDSMVRWTTGNAAMLEGRYLDAYDAYSGDTYDPLTRVEAARNAVLMGDAKRARAALAELVTMAREQGEDTDYRGRIPKLEREVLEGGIAALEGRTDEAKEVFRRALRFWREAGSVIDEGILVVLMAQTLGPRDREVVAAATAVRETLATLGASTLVDRLDEVMTGKSPGRPPAPAPAASAPAATVDVPANGGKRAGANGARPEKVGTPTP